MTTRRFISYEGLLRFSKLCKKRFGMPLSRSQEMLCRTFGFQGMFALQRHASAGGPVAQLSLEEWTRRMRAEVGSDLDELMSSDELSKWFLRIYGPDNLANARELSEGLDKAAETEQSTEP